jgi:polyisoprenoid-binding protein YceI
MIAGTYTFSPENATLKLLTVKRSAVALSGHELTIAVQKWQATLRLDGDNGEMSLVADSHSLHVLEGAGGTTALTDDDKARIERAIEDDVLKGCDIEFRSTDVRSTDDALDVHGELDLAGRRLPIVFKLAVSPDGKLTGSAIVALHTWGIKAISAIFGSLPVGDEVHVVIDAAIP